MIKSDFTQKSLTGGFHVYLIIDNDFAPVLRKVWVKLQFTDEVLLCHQFIHVRFWPIPLVATVFFMLAQMLRIVCTTSGAIWENIIWIGGVAGGAEEEPPYSGELAAGGVAAGGQIPDDGGPDALPGLESAEKHSG